MVDVRAERTTTVPGELNDLLIACVHLCSFQHIVGTFTSLTAFGHLNNFFLPNNTNKIAKSIVNFISLLLSFLLS